MPRTTTNNDAFFDRAAAETYAAWFNDSGNESDRRALMEEFRNIGPAKRNRLIFRLREFAAEVRAKGYYTPARRKPTPGLAIKPASEPV